MELKNNPVEFYIKYILQYSIIPSCTVYHLNTAPLNNGITCLSDIFLKNKKKIYT